MRYLCYFLYVIKHKWFVLIASFKLKSSLWLALKHDMDKFYPSIFIPYAKTFYDSYGRKQFKKSYKFNQAWRKHASTNPHHWEYWEIRLLHDILMHPSDMYSYKEVVSSSYMKIPEKYVFEMVADWMGAGRAKHGKWEVLSWYIDNSEKMFFHPKTRSLIEDIIYHRPDHRYNGKRLYR